MTSLLRKSAVATAGAAMVGFALAALASPIAAQEAPAAKAKVKAKAKAKTPEKAVADEAAAEPEPEAKPKAKSSRPAPPDASHRVPMYFGGLGLSAEQKESIYAVEAEYQTKIQELERQADALRERLMAECEEVLTAPQKKALTAARESAAARRKAGAARRKAAAEPDAEPDAEAPAADDPTPAPKAKAGTPSRAPATLD